MEPNKAEEKDDKQTVETTEEKKDSIKIDSDKPEIMLKSEQITRKKDEEFVKLLSEMGINEEFEKAPKKVVPQTS